MSIDLTLCSATLLADPIAPSPESLLHQLDAAREAGFSGISLWTLHHDAARQAGHSPQALLESVRDAGLSIPMVEALMPWDMPDERSVREQAVATFTLAEAVGAQQVVVVTMSSEPLGLASAIERFRLVCDIGADHGIGAMIEFLPWSGIPDLESAWAIIDGTNRPNAGLMLDTWHWQRQPGGPRPDLLRTLPGDRIPVVQLCDSAPDPSVGTEREAMTDRRLPGQGTIDFASLFGVLDEIGARPVIAPEVFNRELAAAGMGSMAARVFEASASLLGGLRS
jgi:sugar phosphate isomerase/epimerase